MAVKFKEEVGRNGHATQEKQHSMNGAAAVAGLEPISEAGKAVTEEEYWRDYCHHRLTRGLSKLFVQKHYLAFNSGLLT